MDPITAMENIKALHRQHWIAATPEEWMEWRKEHPDDKGGMPLFVVDNIGHYRYIDSKYGEEGLALFFKATDWPEGYLSAIKDYVRRFPMDTPLPGEVPGN